MAFVKFVFYWFKTLAGFTPDVFSAALIYETSKISTTIDSLFTSFSPFKKRNFVS